MTLIFLNTIICTIVTLIFLGYYNFWRLVRNPFWPRILMFHDTQDAPSTSMNISPAALERQIQYLLDKQYSFLKVSDLANFNEKKRHILLSFDDGFASNYTHLFELLKKYKVPATIYLTPYIEGIEKLTPSQIQEMQASGLVEFGAHTLTHVNLTKVDDETARREITESKAVVEKLTGAECVSFAYPYGRFEERHIQMVKDAEFTSAATTKKAIQPFNKKNPFVIARINTNNCTNCVQLYLVLSRGRYKL